MDNASETPTPAPAPATPASAAVPPPVEPEPPHAPPAQSVVAEAVDPAPEPAAEPAVPEQWTPEADWPHDTIEFKGDVIAFRVPSEGAWMSYQMAVIEPTTELEQLTAIKRLLMRHLSPASYARVFVDRLGDSDETDYTINTVGELVKLLSDVAQERRNDDG